MNRGMRVDRASLQVVSSLACKLRRYKRIYRSIIYLAKSGITRVSAIEGREEEEEEEEEV